LRYTRPLSEMGLAPTLVDTYRRYKKGTDNFVQWLAETARDTGLVESVFKAGLKEQAPAAGGRLKGKARKEAKKAGLTTNAAKLEVPIKAMVELAEAIVTTNKVEVPRSVLTTLGAVIRGRKDCATWYILNQNDADEEMRKNNARHQYFIEVLEELRDTLKKSQPSTKQTAQQASDPDSKRNANMFACLELEETAELEDIPDVIATPTEVNSKKAEYKLESSEEDVSFAVYCYLKDMTHIRLFVRRTWREFKRGAIGLQTAAFTTNAAIGMIEKLSDDLQDIYPQFKGTGKDGMHLKIIRFMYQGHCSKQKQASFIDVDDEKDDPFAVRDGGQTLHSSTVMCTHTTDLVLSFFFGSKARKLRLSADENRFTKCLSQLASIPLGSVETGMFTKGDLVHKAVWDAPNSGGVDTWQIFAMQILWDTQRELGSALSTGKQLLEETSQELIQGYSLYLDTGGLDDVGKIHKKFRGGMYDRVRHIEALALDSQFQSWVDTSEQNMPWKQGDFPGFSLLGCHPTLCGLILLSIRDEYHRTSTNLASEQGQILVVAHLYNAAKRFGLLPKDIHWADLEYFIKQQGKDWIYIGKEPENPGEIFRHLNLAIGLGISKFAKDHRRPKSGNGSDGRFTVVGMIRRLEYLARFSELSVERHAKTKKLSGESRAFKEKDFPTMAATLARDFLGYEKQSTALSSLDTLSALKQAIEKDESMFRFDVMDLYLRCIQLLRDILVHCINHAPRDYPESYYNRGLGMNSVIIEMFSHLSGHPHHDKLMFPDAVDMLRKVIVKEGSVVLDRAEAQRQNIIARQTEPQSEPEPSFENPPEDLMPLDWRNRFGCIVFQDADGNCRMPFGMPR